MNNWKDKITQSLKDNVNLGSDGNLYVHDWKVIEDIESLLEEQKKEILDQIKTEVEKELEGKYYGWDTEDTEHRETVVATTNEGKPLSEKQVWNICQARMKDHINVVLDNLKLKI